MGIVYTTIYSLYLYKYKVVAQLTVFVSTIYIILWNDWTLLDCTLWFWLVAITLLRRVHIDGKYYTMPGVALFGMTLACVSWGVEDSMIKLMLSSISNVAALLTLVLIIQFGVCVLTGKEVIRI